MKTNFYGPLLTIVAGLLTLSVGLNIVFYQRIIVLDKTITHTMSPVSELELQKFQKEIDRLSNIQYDVKTKQPVKNYLIDSAK